MTRHGILVVAAGQRQRLLQHLVAGEGEAELGRGAHDARRTALEEGAEALLLPDCARRVPEACIRLLALARLDLQARLDDVAGGGEVGGRHAGDGAGEEELEHAELLGLRLAEVVALEVVVGWEVDCGEGDCAGVLVGVAAGTLCCG